jgi:uncharacterized radical SAM superfamily Fe-S cluster-containing enzyme
MDSCGLTEAKGKWGLSRPVRDGTEGGVVVGKAAHLDTSQYVTEGAIPPEQDWTKTCTDTPIKPIEKGLPKTVESLCPECRKVTPARMFEEDGAVWMEKTCPEHGYVKDLYWSDAELYLKAEDWFFGDGVGLSNPQVPQATKCPDQCGLCNMHTSHTGLGNIDLTNRCNLTCPICFANANVQGYVSEPSYEEVVEMLKSYRAERPVAGRMVQFSGGEPTIHPRFLDVIKAAKDLSFSHIQIATNGIRFKSLEFAEKTAEAGLHTLYLQFDGLTEDCYTHTRGRPLLETKMKAIDNIRKAGMKIVFVPTIINTVNDDQVGPILKFAIDNIDVISGISYQPVCFTGRIDSGERAKLRFTLPDIAKRVQEQTGLADAMKDWYPLTCVSPFSNLTGALRGEDFVHLSCHPHCSLGTYFFVSPNGEAVPAPRFLDIEKLFTEMNKLAHSQTAMKHKTYTKVKALNYLRKYFDGSKAPEGLSFTGFLQTMDGLMDKKHGRGAKDGTYTYKTLMVAGMHFMDCYNYQVERVKRCVIHYAAPNGLMYPFCAYNSGPVFRDKVEKKFSIPLEEYKQRQGRSSDTE